MSDAPRRQDGFSVVALGIVSVAVAFLFSAWKWNSAAEVATAVGSITGVIGTLVGAYFGVQVGSDGKQKSEQRRDQAENRLREMRGVLSTEQVGILRTTHPQLFTDL